MVSIPCEDEEFTVEVRDASPSHYLLKIESFSKLSENGINMYESNEFEACNYKWRMIIYPNGDDNIEGNDYMSVYLAIADTSSLPAGWEANVVISFFLFNHLRDNYLVIRVPARRFHKIKSKWGCSKFISHKSLKEPTNGYLVDENCILGAEIFVIKNQGVGECLSLSKGINSYKYEWKIFEFSKLMEACSEEFTTGDHKWKIMLYPTGNAGQNGKSISISLELVDAKGFGCGKRVQAKYSISVKDQVNGEHEEIRDSDWFSAKENCYIWRTFMPLQDLKDPEKGFLVNDCCIVEAEVSVIGSVDDLT